MPKTKELWVETNLHLNKIAETLISLLSTQYVSQSAIERMSSSLNHTVGVVATNINVVGGEVSALQRNVAGVTTAVTASLDNMMKPEMLSAMRDELIRLELENAKSSATLREAQQELILLEEENTKLRTMVSTKPTTGAGDVPATCG
jgi:hypothetical protein